MGMDIQWIEVDWESARKAYAKDDFPEPFTDALEEEEGWLLALENENEDEDLERLCSWNRWLEFNDGLMESARPVYDQLANGFPVLKDVGVIWSEDLAPQLPKDLPNDPEELLFAALAPERVKTVSASLANLDSPALGKLIDDAIESGAVEWFESGDEFLDFIKALQAAFERAASRSRGFVVWAG